jgi:hypothetical protein
MCLINYSVYLIFEVQIEIVIVIVSEIILLKTLYFCNDCLNYTEKRNLFCNNIIIVKNQRINNHFTYFNVLSHCYLTAIIILLIVLINT